MRGANHRDVARARQRPMPTSDSDARCTTHRRRASVWSHASFDQREPGVGREAAPVAARPGIVPADEGSHVVIAVRRCGLRGIIHRVADTDVAGAEPSATANEIAWAELVSDVVQVDEESAHLRRRKRARSAKRVSWRPLATSRLCQTDRARRVRQGPSVLMLAPH